MLVLQNSIKSSLVCGPQPCELFLLIFASVIKQKRETVKNYSSYVQQLAWIVITETKKEVNRRNSSPCLSPSCRWFCIK